MSGELQDEVTQILHDWSGGDVRAPERLMPFVYDELRRLARAFLARERGGHTLQPTALVNEAYLLMVDQRRARWQNRAQFVGVAAQMMRRILVDHARAVQAEKRGGQQFAVSLTEAEGFGESPDLDLLRVNEALERLAALDEQQARVVELRFFGGLTIEEAAEAIRVSHATVERDWKMARAWLRRELDA